MKYLSSLEFYTFNWTQEEEIQRAEYIKEGIARNDAYSEWHSKITPLEHYLHHTSLRVPSGCTDIGLAKFDSYLIDEQFMPTTAEFYPCYYANNTKYCKATLYQNCDSNLDLWTIRLDGNDDYSMSFDILGENNARALWGKLFDNTAITQETFKDYYFSN